MLKIIEEMLTQSENKMNIAKMNAKRIYNDMYEHYLKTDIVKAKIYKEKCIKLFSNDDKIETL